MSNLEILKNKINKLCVIETLEDLQKTKNILLKEIKNHLQQAFTIKDRDNIKNIQHLQQKIYDTYKEKIKTFEKNNNIDRIFLIPNENIEQLHPISRTTEKIYNIMKKLGFYWVNTPEIDYIDNIFTKLNMDDNHPAREDQQSFYLSNNEVLLNQTLRTHCTNLQAHILNNWNEKDDIRGFHIGKVYRCDMDATHTPMFHQFEVMFVSEEANLETFIGFTEDFLTLFFGEKKEVRIRTGFFPFTTPSYGIEVFLNNRWLEIAGSGIIHENVFKANKKKFAKGWAWGMGIERLNMIEEELEDIRCFYKKDIRGF